MHQYHKCMRRVKVVPSGDIRDLDVSLASPVVIVDLLTSKKTVATILVVRMSLQSRHQYW